MIQFRGATVERFRSRRRAATLPRSKDLSTTPRFRPTAPLPLFTIGTIIGLLLWLPILAVAVWLSR